MTMLFNFLTILIFPALFKIANLVDVKLVFDLQEYFNSDVILLANDIENYDVIIKKIHKFKRINMKGFVGVVDVNKDFSKNFLKNQLNSPHQNIMIVMDDNTNLIKKLISIEDLNPKLMAGIIWVNFSKNNNITKFQDLYIPFNCRFFVINKISSFDYEIQDVYEIGRTPLKIYSRFASWKNNELEVYVNGDFYSKRMNLDGHRYKIALSHFVEYRKQYAYLWELFSERMNFSISWKVSDIGNVYPNGTKTKMFKLVYDRELDGSPDYIIYNHERLKIYDYIFPTSISDIKIYAKVTYKTNWRAYLAPFNKEVWLAIFLWVVLISSVKYLIIRFNKWQVTAGFEGSFFSALKALFGQAGILNTSSSSFFILYLMPYFFAIVLTQYYAGALSSRLAVKSSDLPFNNIEEVIKDRSYKITVLDRSYELFYFRTNADPVAVAIRENNLLLGPNELARTYNDGFRQLCNNRLVFLAPSRNLLIKEQCEIIELNEVILREISGIIVWKGFPLKKILNKVLRQIQSSGLIDMKEKNKIISFDNSAGFKPFTIDVVSPIHFFYSIALGLSILILFREIAWKRLKGSIRTKKKINISTVYFIKR